MKSEPGRGAAERSARQIRKGRIDMKKVDVEVGKIYIVKVSGHLVPVKLTRVCEYGGWYGRNTRSGREVRVRSAARLRREYKTTALNSSEVKEFFGN